MLSHTRWREPEPKSRELQTLLRCQRYCGDTQRYELYAVVMPDDATRRDILRVKREAL